MVASPRKKAKNDEYNWNECGNITLGDVTAAKLLQNGRTNKGIAQLRQDGGGPDGRRGNCNERCPPAPTAECQRADREGERDQPNRQKRRLLVDDFRQKWADEKSYHLTRTR